MTSSIAPRPTISIRPATHPDGSIREGVVCAYLDTRQFARAARVAGSETWVIIAVGVSGYITRPNELLARKLMLDFGEKLGGEV